MAVPKKRKSRAWKRHKLNLIFLKNNISIYSNTNSKLFDLNSYTNKEFYNRFLNTSN